MPFDSPSLPTIFTRVRGDVQSALAGADAWLRRSFEGVITKAQGGLAYHQHRYLRWVARQLFPATAEEPYMLRHASMYKMSLTPAVKSKGPATIAGSNGTPCPAGTQWQRNDGRIYVQDSVATISGGTATIQVTALVAGKDGDADATAPLTIVSPVVGINANAVVASPGITGGADKETPAQLLARFQTRLATPPRGGGKGDYRGWLEDLFGGSVVVWERKRWLGPGKVGVFFAFEDPTTLLPVLPTGGQISDAQEKIDSKCPQTAKPTAYTPVAHPVAYTVSITPDTTALRTAVTNQLRQLHYARKIDLGGALLLWRIENAIGNVPGITNFTLTSPAANVTPAGNAIPTFNGVTFT